MNKVSYNTAAVSAVVGLFLLQASVAGSMPYFLFFPAVSLYLATYMTNPVAFLVGVFIGSVWDSMSLMSSVFYALVFGISMGGVSFCMKIMDERNVLARGFITCCFLLFYGVFLGLLFFFFGKERDILLLHTYDILVSMCVLLGIISTRVGLQKLLKYV